MSASRTSFYLDKANAKWLGVCSGIADYTGIDVTWVRVITIAMTILTMHSLFWVYLIIAWVAKPKPKGLYASPEEAEFWQGVRQSPGRSARDVRSKFRDIDRRLGDVETHYTSGNSRLSNEIDKLR